MSSRAGFLIVTALLAGLSASRPAGAQYDGNAWIDAARRAAPERASKVPMPARRPRPPARAAAAEESAPAAPPLPEQVERAEETAAAPPVPEEKPEETRDPVTGQEPPAAAAPPPRPERAPGPPVEAGPTWPHEAAAARALGGEIAMPAEVTAAVETAGAVEETGTTPEAEARPARPSGERSAALAPLPVRKPPKPAAGAPSVSPRAGGAPARNGPGNAGQSAKCAALAKCRDEFASCKTAFIEKEGEWDLEKEPCGAAYKVCIRKNFQAGEMFFTRWFWPYEECP